MPNSRPLKVRYAHSAGVTFLSYSNDGKVIVTAGSDGEVHIWRKPYENDNISLSVAECCTALTVLDEKIYVGTDRGVVCSLHFPSGVVDKTVLCFKLAPTFIISTPDHINLICGSADFDIKMVNVTETSKIKFFIGHKAPILALSCDSAGNRLCSTSCDGTVRIWRIETQTILKTFDLLPRINDITFAHNLCRPCWAFNDRFIIVPCELNATVIDVHKLLVDSVFASSLSVDEAPHCAAYHDNLDVLAVGFNNGKITFFNNQFDALSTFSTIRPQAIHQIAWAPGASNELAFVTKQGFFGVITDEMLADALAEKSISLSELNGISDPDLLKKAKADSNGSEDDISIMAIKKSIDQKYNLDHANESGSRSPSVVEEIDDDELIEVKEPKTKHPTVKRQVYFQPSSTPYYLSQSFMVWNEVGIVTKFDITGEDKTIEVEFHNASHHHNMHISNINNEFDIAALSENVLVLANETRMKCFHYNSWAMTREWEFTKLLEDEGIIGVAASNKIVVVVTSERLLRCFTVGGLRMQTLCIPGDPVSLCAHENSVCVFYHSGDCLLEKYFDMCREVKCLVHAEEQVISCLCTSFDDMSVPQNSFTIPILLHKESFLYWIGFSDLGSIYYCDTHGFLRVIKRANNGSATIHHVMNMKSFVKSNADNYWIISVSEIKLQIRSVFCKASNFPALVPRPTAVILKLQIDGEIHEKDSLEYLECESMTLSLLHNSNSNSDEFKVKFNQALMKLFVCCVSSHYDYRAMELLNLMNSDYLHVALKCAHRLNRKAVEDRINLLLDGSGHSDEKTENPQHVRIKRKLSESSTKLDLSSFSSPNNICDESVKKEDANTSSPLKSYPFKVVKSAPSASDRSVFKQLENSQKLHFKQVDFTSTKNKPWISRVGATRKSSSPIQDRMTQKTIQSTLKLEALESPAVSSTPKKKTSKTAYDFWFEEHLEQLRLKHGEKDDDELRLTCATEFACLPLELKYKYLEKSKNSKLESQTAPSQRNEQCESSIVIVKRKKEDETVITDED